MGYKEAREELKERMDKGIDYMEMQMEVQLDSYGFKTGEYKRVKNISSGIHIAKRHIPDLEKKYNLNEVDNAEQENQSEDDAINK